MLLRTSFQRILQKFYLYWSGLNNKADKDKSTDSDLSDQEIDTIHSLSIILHPNDTVDLIMMHPDLERLSDHEISNEAEKFAELLLYVTNALMEPKLLATISNKSKSTESVKEQLFYDNVITYYQIVKKEFEHNMLEKGPVIRPIAVFNTK